VIIRPETAADHDAIRKVNDEAFGDPLEAKLVDAIRESDRFVPELSLVAVSEGQTRGHVISSYVDACCRSGRWPFSLRTSGAASAAR
jgi:putative acetyltransferase